MSEPIPPPGIRNGKMCDCMCHKLPGVKHIVGCCTPMPKVGRPRVNDQVYWPRGMISPANPLAGDGGHPDLDIVRSAMGDSMLDSPWVPKIGMALAAYHGVRRNNGSLLWGAIWALAGRFMPVATVAFSVAQGYAQKKGCP